MRRKKENWKPEKNKEDRPSFTNESFTNARYHEKTLLKPKKDFRGPTVTYPNLD